MPDRRMRCAIGFGATLCVFAAVCIATVCIATAGRAADPPRQQPRVAIVAPSAATAGLVDVLTAALADEPGLALVERQAIAQVVGELELAGGAKVADATLKLGGLLAADAILFLAPEPRAEPPQVRLKLVEARTGIRLGDWPVPAAGMNAGDVADVRAGLRPAVATLGMSPADRHLVGMIGIRPEVANSELSTTSRALSVLVGRDLAALPGVVVLDRDQLRRLADERNLTGVELDLKASTRILEGGIRRVGDRFAVTLKMVPLAGGAGRTVEFTSAADLAAVRRAAIESIAGLFDADPPTLPSPADTAAESAHLAARAKRLTDLLEHAEAIRLAEAAYALAPSKETFQVARDAYSQYESQLASGLLRRKDEPDWSAHWFNSDLYATTAAARKARLETLVRWAELVRDFYEHCARDPAREAAFPIWAAPLFWRRVAPQDDEERRLADEYDRIGQKTYERILAVRRMAGGQGAADLILRRLKAVGVLVWGTGTFSGEKLATFLREIDEDIAKEAAAGRLPADRDGFAAHYHELVWRAVHQYEHPAPPVAEIRPLLDSLAANEVAGMRLIGWSRLLELPDDAGAEAAERFLDTLFSGRVRRGAQPLDEVTGFDQSSSKAAQRLAAAGRLGAFLDRLITAAEKARDLSPLLAWPGALLSMINSDRENAATLSERVDALLASQAYAVAAKPAADLYLRWAKLRREKSTQSMQSTQASPLAAPKAGRLDVYEVRNLPLSSPEPGFGHLAMVHVDRTPDGDPQRPLVLVWSKHRTRPSRQRTDPPEFDYVVGRVGTDGGAMRVEGRWRTPLHAILDMASAGGRHAFGTESHGLAIVTGTGTTRIADDHGLPAGWVGPMAWLDDRLYTAVENGFVAVDPDTKSCEVIASGRSLRSRNPLDGVGAFVITGIAADPPRGRLVILVTSREPDLKKSPAGLWSFSPRRGDWSRLAPPGCFGLVWGGDAVFFARRDSPDEVPHRVDLATSVIAPLPGYAKDALPYADQRNPGWTIFDDLLFFPSPVRGRTGARDASGVEHSWSQGSGCHGRVIHRVGDELVIFDEFGSRPQVIRRRRPDAAPDRPQDPPP
jgi:hypothetical protein